MAGIYTRTQLKQRLNANIKGKIGMLVDANETINGAVRSVIADVDFRSLIRQVQMASRLFSGANNYAFPNDAKGTKLIDLVPQTVRADGSLTLEYGEAYDLEKAFETGIVAVDEINGVKVLRVSSAVNSTFDRTISQLDSLTDAVGSWQGFGDAANLRADQANYISGAGSIAFDISAGGGLTAGIQDFTLQQFDLTNYLSGAGSIFIWAYIVNPIGIVDYRLRLGTSVSGYYEMIATAQTDATPFVAGWNLLRFDLPGVAVGTIQNNAIIYGSMFMTKLASKINEVGYRFDMAGLKLGAYYSVKYYGQFGWISTGGVFKEASTNDLDTVLFESDEINLLLDRMTQAAADEIDESDLADRAQTRYNGRKGVYTNDNPSQAKLISYSYYNYGNGGGSGFPIIY